MLMNKKNLSEFSFGLILTIIIFFVLDVIVPNMNWIIRVIIVLVLFYLGNSIFRKLFLNGENS